MVALPDPGLALVPGHLQDPHPDLVQDSVLVSVSAFALASVVVFVQVSVLVSQQDLYQAQELAQHLALVPSPDLAIRSDEYVVFCLADYPDPSLAF